ncbi:MAG: succinylglutamate desuccinylase/aspartoacylase family protein [Proteobacteria bacterium]|nr:succinylglutamate desuccinylase/aspartoacylase family protein [Pseudomonadota bacterium]
MKTVEVIDLPYANIGTRRSLKVIRYRGQNSQKKIYIQAGLHADEPPGFLVLHHLISLLDEADKNGKIEHEIIIVPVANPIGISQWQGDQINGRFYFYDGVNFNRNYPGFVKTVEEKVRNQLTTSETTNISLIREAIRSSVEEMPDLDETDFLKKTLLSLSYDCDLVIDLHCDEEALFHLYSAITPDPEPIINFMGVEVTLLESPTNGPKTFDQAISQVWLELADYFPEFPIPPACQAVTVELRGSNEVNHTLAKQDASNLFALMQHSSILQGDPPVPQSRSQHIGPLDGVQYLQSTIPGIIIFQKKPGDFVKKGDIVAEVFDPLADDQEHSFEYLKATTSGILFARVRDRYAKPGRYLAKVAGKKILEGKTGTLLTL